MLQLIWKLHLNLLWLLFSVYPKQKQFSICANACSFGSFLLLEETTRLWPIMMRPRCQFIENFNCDYWLFISCGDGGSRSAPTMKIWMRMRMRMEIGDWSRGKAMELWSEQWGECGEREVRVVRHNDGFFGWQWRHRHLHLRLCLRLHVVVAIRVC